MIPAICPTESAISADSDTPRDLSWPGLRRRARVPRFQCPAQEATPAQARAAHGNSAHYKPAPRQEACDPAAEDRVTKKPTRAVASKHPAAPRRARDPDAPTRPARGSAITRRNSWPRQTAHRRDLQSTTRSRTISASTMNVISSVWSGARAGCGRKGAGRRQPFAGDAACRAGGCAGERGCTSP